MIHMTEKAFGKIIIMGGVLWDITLSLLLCPSKDFL